MLSTLVRRAADENQMARGGNHDAIAYRAVVAASANGGAKSVDPRTTATYGGMQHSTQRTIARGGRNWRSWRPTEKLALKYQQQTKRCNR